MSKNLKPFVSKVITDGKVQKAFAAKIGKPAGACVAAGVKKGMSGASIRDVVRDCAKKSRDVKLF